MDVGLGFVRWVGMRACWAAGLSDFVKRMRVRSGVVRIVHGDDGAKVALKGLLEGLGCGVLIPVLDGRLREC